MKYDVRCQSCRHEWEIDRKNDEPNPRCVNCGDLDVLTIWKTVPILDKAKDPYDYLTGKGSVPDGKRIFSGPKTSSKTTV